MKTGFGNTTQGKPCSGLVLALYGIAVYEYHFFTIVFLGSTTTAQPTNLCIWWLYMLSACELRSPTLPLISAQNGKKKYCFSLRMHLELYESCQYQLIDILNNFSSYSMFFRQLLIGISVAPLRVDREM